ncbi:hypothetical protein [Lichenibacterium ramalinae]|uniref:3',5'-cyclic-nucleotide phosphodiesterase n=1 Tax=Lichenibacterium ramalinae TaxID=2316527 RepID=A0A4Q2RES5_9HYPH|nr:hypothetical protein [Lichenibacterium ramalinae]RYB06439.1 hypothetical protein D3272_06760 [Lichenibacterium ramalinae]
MRIAGTLSIVVTLALVGPALAGTEHLSPEFRQQAMQACTGDAMRLCPQTLLDEEKTAACMKVYRAQLSPGCRAVYDQGIRAQRQ